MEIKTVGVGKVMSAAVLILAAGTKGKRYIGKNCRLMLHGVHSGAIGKIDQLEQNIKETKNASKLFINSLKEETLMSKKQIKEMLKEPLDQYLKPEQAIELGIADQVF